MQSCLPATSTRSFTGSSRLDTPTDNAVSRRLKRPSITPASRNRHWACRDCAELHGNKWPDCCGFVVLPDPQCQWLITRHGEHGAEDHGSNLAPRAMVPPQICETQTEEGRVPGWLEVPAERRPAPQVVDSLVLLRRGCQLADVRRTFVSLIGCFAMHLWYWCRTCVEYFFKMPETCLWPVAFTIPLLTLLSFLFFKVRWRSLARAVRASQTSCPTWPSWPPLRKIIIRRSYLSYFIAIPRIFILCKITNEKPIHFNVIVTRSLIELNELMYFMRISIRLYFEIKLSWKWYYNRYSKSRSF